MAGDKDRDTLLDLFSTRSREGAVERPSVQSAAKDERGVRRPTQGGPVAGGARVTLSPIASAVLREARRELGNREAEKKGGESKEISEDAIAKAVDSVCASRGFTIDDIARADIIVHLKRDLLGWGVLQPLIDNPEVTDIHCYDYQTVVLQRGKMCEATGLHWPTPEAYSTFIDRVLFRLGKSLSTQQHTVDASFPDGKRLCAVHESVCGARGPLLTIRVPRVAEATLESLVSYQVAPPLMVNYLAALTRTCEHTFIVAGETGTGKTTLMRCLGTQFRADEAVIGVEDTPELNYQHPYYRSLVSRSPNTEGVGEVTLQEHIRTTLRLCPTRVILGEMRTPEAAESFLEAAQTGHSGMSTVHARNARETLTRLESLLGRAQRGVAMEIIRQQIALAVDVVVWQCRERVTGKVRMAEVIEVGHFVEGNIQIRPMFKLVEQGDNPQWEVLSYSSFHEEVLEQNGIYLGDAPKFLGFSNTSNVPAAQEASSR
jgi:pilus assembly protein CpaF